MFHNTTRAKFEYFHDRLCAFLPPSLISNAEWNNVSYGSCLRRFICYFAASVSGLVSRTIAQPDSRGLIVFLRRRMHASLQETSANFIWPSIHRDVHLPVYRRFLCKFIISHRRRDPLPRTRDRLPGHFYDFVDCLSMTKLAALCFLDTSHFETELTKRFPPMRKPILAGNFRSTSP